LLRGAAARTICRRKESEMKAIRFHEFGGPEVLKYEDVPEPELR
jgi:hypothetical protein